MKVYVDGGMQVVMMEAMDNESRGELLIMIVLIGVGEGGWQ